MSITLEVKQLRAATGDTAEVVSRVAATVPIFANVLIQEEAEGWVRFVATDLDVWIERRVQAVKGELARAPLGMTVSARLLSTIATKLPQDAQVAITIDGKQMRLQGGRSDFRLATLPTDEFPSLTPETWDAEFAVNADTLAGLFHSVSFAMGDDPTRYYLQGIFLVRVEVDGVAMLRAVATDGHRLARAQVPLPDGAERFPEKGVIVPRRAIGVIGKLINHMKPGTEDAPRMLQVAVSERRMEFDFGAGEHGETRFWTKMIDGQFPDYNRVIPTGNPHTLTIDPAALSETVERVATIASDKTRAVKVSIAKDLVTATVISPEHGKAEEELPGSWSGSPIDFGFNSKYLIDVLDRVTGDSVTARLGESNAPTLWEGGDKADVLFVLMPMRV